MTKEINSNSFRGKELRERYGFSLEDVFNNTGILPPQLNFFEKGIKYPSIDMGLLLAKLYKVDLSFLYGISNSPRTMKNVPLGNNLQKIASANNINEENFFNERATELNLSLEDFKKFRALPTINVFDKLLAFSKYFDVSIEYILGLRDDPFIPGVSKNGKETYQLKKEPVTRLKMLKERDDLSVKELADAFGLTSHTIWNIIENSTKYNPNLNTCITAAKVFNTNIEYFLKLSDIDLPNDTYIPSINFNDKVKESDLSLSEFIKQLKLRRKTYEQYSTTPPIKSISLYIKMANILNCSVDYLLGLTYYKTWEDALLARQPELWMEKGMAIIVADQNNMLSNMLCIQDSPHIELIDANCTKYIVNEDFLSKYKLIWNQK